MAKLMGWRLSRILCVVMVLQGPAFVFIALCTWSYAATLPGDISLCAPPSWATAVKIPEGVPMALWEAVYDTIGEIAVPGQSFNETDTSDARGPNSRYIFVWHSGTRWVVATEHGGIVYNDPMLVYKLSDSGQVATLLEQHMAFPPTVCRIARELAHGEGAGHSAKRSM